MSSLYRSFLKKFRDNFIDSYNQSVLIKTEQELKHIYKACQITTKVYKKILKKDLEPGVTEKYIAEKIQKYSIALGADKEMSFPTIVGSGPNSSLIHSIPSNRKIRKGDVIQFDFGAKVDGFCSDFSRVVFMGTKKNCPEIIKHYYQLVKNAQVEAIKDLDRGESFKDVSKKVDDVFKRQNLHYNYLHSLGHGVGEDIHQHPRIASIMESALIPEKNMVVTIEPGLYFPGSFGFRVEDTVVIQEFGAEVLTKASKRMYLK